MRSILDTMIRFFNWVQETIDHAADLIHFVGQVIRIVISYAKYILSVFPGWVYGILVGIIVVSALYVILGRSSSS